MPSNILGRKKAVAPTTMPKITAHKIDFVILYEYFNKCVISRKTNGLFFYFKNVDIRLEKMSTGFDGHF